MRSLPLIPAKAGIQQQAKMRRLIWQKLDPRLRGDERPLKIATGTQLITPLGALR